jgi:hypothetical protein
MLNRMIGGFTLALHAGVPQEIHMPAVSKIMKDARKRFYIE